MGLRKFLLAGVGPLGCIPNQLVTGLPLSGKCVSFVNDIVGLFNKQLGSLVNQLNANHSGAIFVYGNTYGVFTDILNNPSHYGKNFYHSATNASCFSICIGLYATMVISFHSLERNTYYIIGI